MQALFTIAIMEEMRSMVQALDYVRWDPFQLFLSMRSPTNGLGPVKGCLDDPMQAVTHKKPIVETLSLNQWMESSVMDRCDVTALVSLP